MTVYHEIRVRLPYGPPIIQSTFGGVVELVTMPDCQSGGEGSSPFVTATNDEHKTEAYKMQVHGGSVSSENKGCITV